MDGIFSVDYSDSKNIKTINSFVLSQNHLNNSRKSVAFVRFVGFSSNLEEELNSAELKMSSMSGGDFGYIRVEPLPNIESKTDIGYYSSCFNSWNIGGKKYVLTRHAVGDCCGILSDALAFCTDKLRLVKKGLSESMEKNFVIKLMFWFDNIVDKLGFPWSPSVCVKIIAENVTKPQEYLFYCLLTRLGFDVLLLQYREDIDLSVQNLGLSEKNIIGTFTDIKLSVSEYRHRQKTSSPSRKNRRALNVTKIDANAPISPVHITSGNQSQQDSVMSNSAETQSRGRYDVIRGVPSIPQRQNEPVTVTIPQRPQRGSRNQNQNNIQSQQPYKPQQISSQGNRQSFISGTVLQPQRSAMPANRSEKSLEELAGLASSVVMILVHDSSGDVIAGGSGVMIGKNGYILTNCHVASKGNSYTVKIENDEMLYPTNELIKYNADLDLAVLRIKRTLDIIPIYNGSSLARGQRVVAIGSPIGLFNTVSDGIISGFRKDKFQSLIQFTAPISNGSSGGALLNMYGELIGISSAGFDEGQNLNLAVSYDSITPFVSNFI